MTISANKITRQNVDDTGKKADKPEKRQDKPEKRQDGASRIMRVRAKKQEKTIKKPGRKPSSCGQPDTVAASAVVPFQRMQWHSVAPALYTPPRLRQWEKGGYAASTPERNATGYMPMLGPLSLSRLLLRCWASLACSCWCLTTSGWVNTAFTVRAT